MNWAIFWRDRWCGKSSHNYMDSTVYVRYPLDVWLFAQTVGVINGSNEWLTLVFAFAIIASVFIVFIREYNFKYAWIQWLLLAIWVVLLILFVAFMYATFGPRMFMRWN